MEKAIPFSLIYGQEKRTFGLNFYPTFNQIITIITQQYPALSNKTFSLGYKDNRGEFYLAKNDTELNEAYRFANQSNEISLYITSEDDNDDTMISTIDSCLSRLNLLSNEIDITKQKYVRTIKDKQTEQQKKLQFYSQNLESEKAKSNHLENELKKLKDSISSINAEIATCRESFSILVVQYKNKMQEAAELKKDRDEKVMLEAKLKTTT